MLRIISFFLKTIFTEGTHMTKQPDPSELIYVGFYQAPDRDINPGTISASILLLEVLTGGGVFFNHNGERRLFKRGTVFAHAPGDTTIHDRLPEDPYRCLVLRFGFSKNTVPQVPRVSFWNDLDYLDDFVAEAMESYYDESCDHELLGQWLWSTALWQVSASSRRRVPEYPTPVARALTRIDRDPGKVKSVKQLAAKCGVTAPYFQSLFKHNLGVTPHKYLLTEKLKKARTLLAGTDEPIKNVAEDCGFVNIETFYRAFNRHSGITPGEFRRRHSPLYRLEQ
jgi:AraC-like DNA-binding protein